MVQKWASLNKQRFIFAVATVLPIPLESIGVFLYQHATYWADYTKVRPGLSVPGHFLYSHGPLYVIVLGGLYVLMAGLLVYFLPRMFSVAVGLFFWVNHIPGLLGITTVDILKIMNVHDTASARGIDLIVSNLGLLIACLAVSFGLLQWLTMDKRKIKKSHT